MGRFGLSSRSLWAYLLFLSIFWGSPTAARDYPTRYDGAIKAAVSKWWPDLPEWKWLKAQYWQESRLDPTAVSGVDAEGIAQFMSPTWIDVTRALGWPTTVSRHDAAMAIEAGAYYQMRQRTAWSPQARTAVQRNDLGLASYNGGLAHILKAQSECGDARLWPEISPCLEKVTGHYSHETLQYVTFIHRWYQELELSP